VRGGAKEVIEDAAWLKPTGRIIGVAMEIHNELGPGHREYVHHDAMAAKLTFAGLEFEDEPHAFVTLEDGTVVGSNKPDLIVAETVIVELKARPHSMTRDDQAQVIGYFAGWPQCPVALFINFGRPRLEYRRLLPPRKVVAFQRSRWVKAPF